MTLTSLATSKLIEKAEKILNDPRPLPRIAAENRHIYHSIGRYWWPKEIAEDGDGRCGNGYGCKYVIRDGCTNPDNLADKRNDRTALARMVAEVCQLSLATQFGKSIDTDCYRYGKAAVERIRTWFIYPETRMLPNLERSQCLPNGELPPPGFQAYRVIDSRSLTTVLDCLEYLSDDYLTAVDQEALVEWFQAFLDWLVQNNGESGHLGNNIGTYYWVQIIRYAEFVGNESLHLAKKWLHGPGKALMARFVANNFGTCTGNTSDIDGAIHRSESHRNRPLLYSVYNLRGLVQLAQLGSRILAGNATARWWQRQLEGVLTRSAKSLLKRISESNETKNTRALGELLALGLVRQKVGLENHVDLLIIDGYWLRSEGNDEWFDY